MPSDERQQSWQQRYLQSPAERPFACRVLSENTFLLPGQGKALDLACGRGGNALLLARMGLQTEAWDYASAAVETLESMAMEEGLSLDASLRDVANDPPPPDSFDVITVSYFLERKIVPDLVRALRAGGLIFYETWLRESVDDSGPRNPDFRLGPNELLTLFSRLQVISYCEHGLQGDLSLGVRNVASLIARC